MKEGSGVRAKRFPVVKHGTRNGYANGCRCAACSHVESTYRAELYAKKRGKPVEPKQQSVFTFLDPHALEVGEISVLCNSAKARKLAETFGWELCN